MAETSVWDRIGSELVPAIRRLAGLNNDALWIEYSSRSGTITHASAALIRVLGWNPSGSALADIIHPDDRPATAKAWELMSAGTPVTDGFPNRYIAGDGSAYVWLVWSPPLATDGEDLGVVACLHVPPDSVLYPALEVEAVSRKNQNG